MDLVHGVKYLWPQLAQAIKGKVPLDYSVGRDGDLVLMRFTRLGEALLEARLSPEDAVWLANRLVAMARTDGA